MKKIFILLTLLSVFVFGGAGQFGQYDGSTIAELNDEKDSDILMRFGNNQNGIATIKAEEIGRPSTKVLYLTMPQFVKPINLRAYIDAHNPLNYSRIEILNTKTQPHLNTGNLGGKYVKLTNKGQFQGSATSGIYTSGITLATKMTLLNYGYVRGAGKDGVNGRKGANGAKGAKGRNGRKGNRGGNAPNRRFVDRTYRTTSLAQNGSFRTNRAGQTDHKNIRQFNGGTWRQYIGSPIVFFVKLDEDGMPAPYFLRVLSSFCGQTGLMMQNNYNSICGGSFFYQSKWRGGTKSRREYWYAWSGANVYEDVVTNVPGGRGGAGGAGGIGGAGGAGGIGGAGGVKGIGQYFRHNATRGTKGRNGAKGRIGQNGTAGQRGTAGTINQRNGHWGYRGGTGQTGQSGARGATGATGKRGTDGTNGTGWGAWPAILGKSKFIYGTIIGKTSGAVR